MKNETFNLNDKNSLLEVLKKLVELYNKFESEKELQLITKEEKEEDVSNIFICFYNEEQLGLFERKLYHNLREYGEMYKGLNNDYLGIKVLGTKDDNNFGWKHVGYELYLDEKRFVTTCNMVDAISFDDVRFKMYNEGIIPAFKLGKASIAEMIEVKKYAQKHCLSEEVKKRTKIK